jgi:hypothetical protein
MIGKDPSSLIEMPAADDTDGRLSILRQLGAGENVDAYKLEMPEGVPDHYGADSEMATWLRTKSAELGMLPGQTQALYGEFVQVLAKAEADMQEKQTLDTNERLATLKTELGGAFEPRTQAAAQTISALGGDFAKAIEDAGLNLDPAVINGFAKIAPMLTESKQLDGNAPVPGFKSIGMTPAEINQKAEKLQSESIAALRTGTPEGREKSRQLQEEALALRSQGLRQAS